MRWRDVIPAAFVMVAAHELGLRGWDPWWWFLPLAAVLAVAFVISEIVAEWNDRRKMSKRIRERRSA